MRRTDGGGSRDGAGSRGGGGSRGAGGRKRWMFALLCLGALGAFGALAGCGGGGGGSEPVPPTCEELALEAWALFESGNIDGARSRFEEAIDSGACGDAYLGRAWIEIHEDELAAALDDLDAATGAGFSGPVLFAGLAVVLRDLEPVDYAAAIAAADSALARDRRFEFAYDASFDWQDLHLIIAQSRFALGEYELANAAVDSLPDGVVQDPGSPTFVEDLMAEIERLGGLIRGT